MSEITAAPRILIADDDPLVRALLAETLEAHGAEVTAVADGKQAACEAMLRPFDVCILDVEMPVMTGFEACEKLRESAFTRSLPVLFLTGRNDAEAIEKAFAAGAWDFLNKPVQPVLLWHRVSNLLLLARLVKERDNLNAVMADSDPPPDSSSMAEINGQAEGAEPAH